MNGLLAVSQHSISKPLLGPVGFLVAFFVGTISFFSPCILPLLPGYLSFVSGLSGEDLEGSRARRRMLLGVGLFILGFATMFTLLGAAASAVGDLFLRHLAGFNRIAGALIIVMGLMFLVPSLFPFIERERRPLMTRVKPGLAGAFPLGLAFAIGWSPCVGPGLGVMLNLGAQEGSVGRGAFLLFFFSLGFGVWFLLGALGMRRAFSASGWLRRHTPVLQVFGGTVMIAIGLLLVLNRWDSVLAPLRRLINRWSPPV